MPPEIIESVSVTPIPSSYQKELGKNAYADNRGTQWLEWVVRAKSTGGAEGITIANRFMRQSTVAKLLEFLNGSLLGREVDALLEISNGIVTGPGPGMERWYRHNGWLSILARPYRQNTRGICDRPPGRQEARNGPGLRHHVLFPGFSRPGKGCAADCR
jgi:hypothetical protein